MNGESGLQSNAGNQLKRKTEDGVMVPVRSAEPPAAKPASDQIQGPEKKKLKTEKPGDKSSSHLNNATHNRNGSHKHHTTKNNKLHSPLNNPIKKEATSPMKQVSSTEKHKNKIEHTPPIKVTIKKEVISPTKPSKPIAESDDDDDDVPLASRTISKIKTPKAKPEEKKKPSAKSSPANHKVKASKSLEVKKKLDHKSEVKKEVLESDDDSKPLSVRAKKIKSEKMAVKKSDKKDSASAKKNLKRKKELEDSDEEPLIKSSKKVGGKKIKKEGKDAVPKKKVKKEEPEGSPKKTKAQLKKEEEEKEIWKWWEEEPLPEGIKWRTLEHKGPYFPPPYERLPKDVKFYYDDEVMELSDGAEEVAGFYARMLDHDYTTKEIFNNNFFEDWRKEMTDEERKIIKHLKKCNFKEMHEYFVKKAEERRNWTKEQKQELKQQNEKIQNEYGYCLMDGHKEKVGNFKIEPPGLFRGRGDHPKQGKLKHRIRPEDIIINIGKDAKVPQAPDGHKWKAVQYDNKVTWLACWIENIQGSYKYVMLNPTSRIKGEKDWQKYETARKLKGVVHRIREQYMDDWRAKEMRIRQRGVALYFIDKLALRAGHEKDEETADTVGCCSLRVEHIKLHPEWEDKEFVVEFDFLGKDSVRYQNWVPVEKRVYKNVQRFLEGKQDGDDLFDRLTTASLNKHLSDLMEGLTAKVFRTYNASHTLQEQLNKLTNPEDNAAAKLLAYNRANRAVAILCNHQRAVPKTFDKTMSNLQNKITEKKKAIKAVKKEAKELKARAKANKNDKNKAAYEKKKAQVARLEDQLFKLEMTVTDKEENKEIALGTSKLNYLDPRITVSWCKKYEVPIEKVYSKTHRQKFAWAIAMADKDFQF